MSTDRDTLPPDPTATGLIGAVTRVTKLLDGYDAAVEWTKEAAAQYGKDFHAAVRNVDEQHRALSAELYEVAWELRVLGRPEDPWKGRAALALRGLVDADAWAVELAALATTDGATEAGDGR